MHIYVYTNSEQLQIAIYAYSFKVVIILFVYIPSRVRYAEFLIENLAYLIFWWLKMNGEKKIKDLCLVLLHSPHSHTNRWS